MNIPSDFFDDLYNLNSIAWLCDILEEEDRGKAFGILIGISIGLGFTIGLPIGAVLSVPNPYLPVQVSLIISVVNWVVIILAPLDDTISMQTRNHRQSRKSDASAVTTTSKSIATSDSFASKCCSILKYRQFPPDFKSYLVENSMLGVIKVVQEASYRYDWIAVFFLDIAQQTLQLTFILYCVQVFEFTTAQAGIALAIVGITVAVVSPLFLTLFEEVSMVTLGSSVQLVAYVLLAIVGGGVGLNIVYGLGYLAIILLAFGGLWISSIQALILRQYPEERQGEVAGALGQVSLLAVFPAYPISLLFAYTIGSNALFYWPGITYALVSPLHAVRRHFILALDFSLYLFFSVGTGCCLYCVRSFHSLLCT